MIIVLEKDEKSRGTSSPEELIKLANEKIKKLEASDNYDEGETYDRKGMSS